MNSTPHYSCVIIDDELDAIDLLSSRLSYLCDNISIADTFSKWEDALVALRNNNYDIIFLDISMSGKTGFDLLKLLPDIESEIIFVTAHDTYALKAFSYSASGYILKPIDDAELLAATKKATERIHNKKLAGNVNPATAAGKRNEKLRIPNNHGVDYVNVEDILYLESVNKCTLIVTNKAKYMSSANIGTYKHLIDDVVFYQVHRLFIINLNFILRYESSGLIIMQDKKEVPLSRAIKQDFLKLFDKK